jgi:hypothetical protein
MIILQLSSQTPTKAAGNIQPNQLLQYFQHRKVALLGQKVLDARRALLPGAFKLLADLLILLDGIRRLRIRLWLGTVAHRSALLGPRTYLVAADASKPFGLSLLRTKQR